MQHCRLSLGKVAGFAFFFGCVCIVAFFLCLAKSQDYLLCCESTSDEECNIAGCLWGRLQSLHSSLNAFALLHSSFVLLNCKISCYVEKVFQMKSATLQLSLRKVTEFAFFFECLCIVAFFFCLAKLQNRLPCGGSCSDEECNIAGCL